VERPSKRRPRSGSKHEQADNHQPDCKTGDMARGHFEAAAGERQPDYQGDGRK